MTRVGIAIVARSNSKRFPRKVLSKFGSDTIISHLIQQSMLFKKINDICLVTTNNPCDDELVTATKGLCEVFRGSEINVFDRIKNFAVAKNIDFIVVLLGDNPIIDANLGDALLDFHLSSNMNYSALKTLEYPKIESKIGAFPIGTRIQIINNSEILNVNTNKISDMIKEHPWTYFADRIQLKGYGLLSAIDRYAQFDRPDLNFSVNYVENLKMLNFLRDQIKSEKIKLLDYVEEFDRQPQIHSLMGDQ